MLRRLRSAFPLSSSPVLRVLGWLVIVLGAVCAIEWPAYGLWLAGVGLALLFAEPVL